MIVTPLGRSEQRVDIVCPWTLERRLLDPFFPFEPASIHARGVPNFSVFSRRPFPRAKANQPPQGPNHSIHHTVCTISCHLHKYSTIDPYELRIKGLEDRQSRERFGKRSACGSFPCSSPESQSTRTFSDEVVIAVRNSFLGLLILSFGIR